MNFRHRQRSLRNSGSYQIGILLSENQLICHTLISQQLQLFPLHAINKYWVGKQQIHKKILFPPGGKRLRFAGKVHSFPRNDLLILSERPIGKNVETYKHLEWPGVAVTSIPVRLEWLERGPAGVLKKECFSTIKTSVLVKEYRYPSPNGNVYYVTNFKGFILDRLLPRGLSGAPVVCMVTNEVLGIVHGTSSQLGGALVVPLPSFLRAQIQ